VVNWTTVDLLEMAKSGGASVVNGPEPG